MTNRQQGNDSCRFDRIESNRQHFQPTPHSPPEDKIGEITIHELVFWKDVSPFLIRCLNKSHQKGKLALTQRRGVISLIPKKDKALQEVKSWRPITLLNCDYKITSKVIASRLKTVFQNLIDNDQIGFLKGRSIAENMCLINNVISCTQKQRIFPGNFFLLILRKPSILLNGHLSKKHSKILVSALL